MHLLLCCQQIDTCHKLDVRLLCLDELFLTIQIESQLLLDSILFLFVSSKEQRSHDNDDEYAGDQQDSSDRNIAVFGKTIHKVTLDTFRCTGVGVLSRGTLRALDCTPSEYVLGGQINPSPY